ncbi:MAG: trypsin-like peptidase domain-containing protein [Patescibacteria group bacterium]|nr:trypsin-like peptidase domain-containing protein [Patescibacteria group bacterium]
MRIFLIVIISTYLVLLVFSFNVSLAQESFRLVNILDYLKNFVTRPNQNNIISPETTESIFQPITDYKPVVEYESLVTQVIEKVSPAVVSIIITKDVPVFERYYINPFDDSLIPPEFREFFRFEIPEYRQKGTEKKQVGAGTGFIISPDGLIATNKHVVGDQKADYTIFLNDGRKFNGRVIAVHPRDDLALVKINAQNLPTIRLGDSDKIKLGQTVIAIGNALGEFQNTVSVGVISGLRRAITASDERGNVERLENLIQTDAAINPGNSGGPLINLRGEVIGINTAIVSGAQNIGFAIPVNRLKKMIRDVSVKGKVEIPYLGIRYILITDKVKEKFNLPFDYGAYVYSDDPKQPAVIPNSPAGKTGIKEKDIILEFNNKKITPQNSLAQMVINSQVGEIVSLKIWREGKIITLEVRLEKLPTELENQ